MNEWIKCSDRLPDVEYDYLIYTVEKYEYVATWSKTTIRKKEYFDWVIRCECIGAENCFLNNDMVTHWMPLPLPPEGI